MYKGQDLFDDGGPDGRGELLGEDGLSRHVQRHVPHLREEGGAPCKVKRHVPRRPLAVDLNCKVAEGPEGPVL